MKGGPAGFEFGDIRVYLASERVFRAGEPVLLEPKAFQLLLYLVRNAGRLIEKDELHEALWPGTFVSDNALARAVALLRKALGDDAHAPRYVETVPRRGYRFVADVRDLPVASRVPMSPRGRRSRLFVAIGASLVLLGTLYSWLSVRRNGHDAVSFERVAQVTSSDVLDIFPTISPDGNVVAFSSNRDGSFEIYLKQLTPGANVIQLTADGLQNFQPAWSPRGDVIAYASRNGGGIWVVPAFGGTPHRLTDFGGAPAWSPQGDRIVFQSEGLNELGVNAVALPPSTLWTRSIDGGPPRPLTHLSKPPGGHGNAAWSPRGDRIAFVASDVHLSEIWTVSLEGELERLETPALRVYDIVYSPSGDELYFSGHAGEWFELWVLDVDGKSARPRRVHRTLSPAIRYPSFSADGRTLVYSGLATASNLASLALVPDTHEPVGPPRLLTRYTNHRNLFPRFSPDGSELAFARVTAGSGSDIWLIDADGRNERRLTSDPGAKGLPWWSADGKRVIFSAHREEVGSGLWSVDVATGEEEFLRAVPSHWSMATLSRDANHVAFHSRKGGGAPNVWIAPLFDEGEERQLTFDEEMMAFPAWSADGELIALEIGRGGDTHVGFVPSAGGAPVQLTNEPGESWTGAWSQDGDKIAFAASRDGVWNLRWVSRSEGRERQLTDYTSVNTSVRYPTWSPGGDQIVYEYAETTGNIWMIELP